MTVELIMEVSRSVDNRLSGTVRSRHAAKALGFSGTLELMRVFEELVPVDRSASRVKPAGGGDGSPAVPGSSEPSNSRTA